MFITKMLVAIASLASQTNLSSNASPLTLEQAQWLSLFENHLRNHRVSINDFEKVGIARHELPNRYNYLQHDPMLAARIASVELRDEQHVIEEIVIDSIPLPRYSAA